MKVQTKITLLLLAVVAIFMAGLWAFRAFDQQKFRQIRMNRLVEAKRAFDAMMDMKKIDVAAIVAARRG